MTSDVGPSCRLRYTYASVALLGALPLGAAESENSDRCGPAGSRRAPAAAVVGSFLFRSSVGERCAAEAGEGMEQLVSALMWCDQLRPAIDGAEMEPTEGQGKMEAALIWSDQLTPVRDVLNLVRIHRWNAVNTTTSGGHCPQSSRWVRS